MSCRNIDRRNNTSSLRKGIEINAIFYRHYSFLTVKVSILMMRMLAVEDFSMVFGLQKHEPVIIF